MVEREIVTTATSPWLRPSPVGFDIAVAKSTFSSVLPLSLTSVSSDFSHGLPVRVVLWQAQMLSLYYAVPLMQKQCCGKPKQMELKRNFKTSFSRKTRLRWRNFFELDPEPEVAFSGNDKRPTFCVPGIFNQLSSFQISFENYTEERFKGHFLNALVPLLSLKFNGSFGRFYLVDQEISWELRMVVARFKHSSRNLIDTYRWKYITSNPKPTHLHAIIRPHF